MDLYWLPAGQHVDFKIHSDTFTFFMARLPYIYVLICEPLSFYRPGKNLLSLQTLKDHIVFLTLKFMGIVPFRYCSRTANIFNIIWSSPRSR